MAKAAYRPAQMLQEDPLDALKKATEGRSRAEANREVDKINAVPLPLTTAGLLEHQAAPSIAPIEKENLPRPSSASSSIAPMKPLARHIKPARSTFYLYPEDLSKLRMLSGYASTQHGIRANDSLIMRAALSLVESDVRFMHALEEAMMADRRKAKT